MDAQSRACKIADLKNRTTPRPRGHSSVAGTDVANAVSCTGCLLELLKASIIPTLLAETKTGAVQTAETRSRNGSPDDAEIASFASLCLMVDPTLATAFVRQRVEGGLSVDEIFDDLIAPAARQLGQRWDDDQCDFNRVTIGLSRIQHLALALSRQYWQRRTLRLPAPRAFFAAMPKSQHTLGVLMVSELFGSEGWLVSMMVGATKAQLQSAVQSRSFDVIGLSIGLDCDTDDLRSLVQCFRASAKNRRSTILIGGPLIATRPNLARLVGADAAAVDAKSARKLARALMLLPGQ